MNRSLASALLAVCMMVFGIFAASPSIASEKPMTTVSNIKTQPESLTLERPLVQAALTVSAGTLPKPVIAVTQPIRQAKQTKPLVIRDVKVETQKNNERKARAAVKVVKPVVKVSPKRVASTRTTVVRKTTTTTRVSSVSSGPRASGNWATPGQCTWGALNKWHNYTGYYLGGFHGNAYTWNERARAAGYSVGTTPRAASIVVFEPGVAGASGVGHVAWVTSVSGSRVTFIEMNALAGPYHYNTRTVTHRGGMSYIYAPRS